MADMPLNLPTDVSSDTSKQPDEDTSTGPLLPEVTPIKINLSFRQLWNISFAFFGIQVGWGLQMANTSAIFESLGADAEQLPMLWLAAPVSGLIIQPVVGYLSDRTRSTLGRRRPYFLLGALFSSLALLIMPNAHALWVAAGALWLLDASANISMTPFRSFVADLVPAHQRTKAFSMQGVATGLGAVAASALPWIIARFVPPHLGVAIPQSVKIAFYIGAAAFSGAVLWTIVAAPKPFFPEDASEDLDSGSLFADLWQAVREMPPLMRQLAWVQCFSWLGMFCVFLYFPPAIAHNIFGATEQSTPLYAAGIEWAGLCMALYNLVCCGVSFALPALAHRFSAPVAHGLCLLCGALSLVSLHYVHSQYWLLLPMIGLGIAFASMLSLPYAMLVKVLPPEQNCLYMGIFNCFVVIPEIVAALGLGWFMGAFLGGDRLSVVVLGGGFMAIGAILSLFVTQLNEAPVKSTVFE